MFPSTVDSCSSTRIFRSLILSVTMRNSRWFLMDFSFRS